MGLILRIIGWGLALTSVTTVAVLGLLWFEKTDISQPWGKYWFEAHAASLNQTQSLVQRYLSPDLWDGYAVPMLEWATWQGFALIAGILLVLAIFLLLIGHRRPNPGNRYRNLD